MKRLLLLLSLMAFGRCMAEEIPAPTAAMDSLEKYKVVDRVSQEESDYANTFVPAYQSAGPEIALDGLQCPIPMENRVKNYTGVQCVYASIEALGRWAEEPRLISPPITSRPDCKSYSSPKRAAEILNKLGVRFEQTYGDREKGIALLRKAMSEGRGALWDVPGHAMVIVHYSEKEDRVCWIDNSDYSLRIHQTTVAGFKKRWSSWILVIYPDKDVFPEKTYKYFIPVLDVDEPSRIYNKNFVPIPRYIN